MLFCRAAKPRIDSIVHVNSLTGTLVFSPNQPSQFVEYRVSSYNIQSRLEHCHWVEVLSKTLLPEESLHCEEIGTFPLHLVEDETMCEYRAAMQYQNIEGEVISQVYPVILRPTGKFLSMWMFDVCGLKIEWMGHAEVDHNSLATITPCHGYVLVKA